MLEIEAKIQLEDFTPILARLYELKATPLGKFQETNTFFDTPDRRLLAADKGLRLRRQQDLSNKSTKFILTFKGPNRPGLLKQREERELVVPSDTDAIALFHSLGYEQIFQFQKHRQSWHLRDCEISLDEIPNLGQFIEIEGPGESAIQSVINELHLTAHPPIRDSYVALLLKK